MTDWFWDDPEVVERFAGRDPDHRLVALIEEYEMPAATCVLDLGCAGGRPPRRIPTTDRATTPA